MNSVQDSTGPEAVLLAYTELQMSKYSSRIDRTAMPASRKEESSVPDKEKLTLNSISASSSNSNTDITPSPRTFGRNGMTYRGCSAIRISSNWILAHGTVLYPLMKYTNYGKEFISNLEAGKLYSVPRDFLNDLPLFVYGESTLFSNSSNALKSNRVEIVALWKSPLLTETLKNFFGSWLLEVPGQSDPSLLPLLVLLECSSGIKPREASPIVEGSERKNARVQSQDFISTPRPEILKAFEELAQYTKLEPFRGMTVEIVSTPFGNPIFLGTLSRGVIGKVFGKKDCLLLTDASAFPGSEGGPLYILESRGGKAICGMVIATTCLCRGERTDYVFAANLTTVLQEIRQLVRYPIQSNLALQPPLLPDPQSSYRTNGLVEESIAVVRCGQSWGTAILLDKRTGTFLTCAHIVTEAPLWQIRITTHQGNSERTSTARLIYRTAHNQPYDVAVLTVDPSNLHPLLRPIQFAGRRAHKGEDVLAAGFPFSWSSGATISSGVVSKSLDCMLQTSCCVQSGASGGAIVTRENHRMLGMVVCNAVASSGTALYPRLSMAIPITVIQQPLLKYCQTSDPSILQTLNQTDHLVRKIWKLRPVLLPSNM